jgi:hypothetical protein
MVGLFGRDDASGNRAAACDINLRLKKTGGKALRALQRGIR